MSSIAIIEYQTSGGNWQRVCDCSNRPAVIKSIMDSIFQSNPNYQKLRALDAQTKQMLDMAIRA